jgi:hypothetical protein
MVINPVNIFVPEVLFDTIEPVAPPPMVVVPVAVKLKPAIV